MISNSYESSFQQKVALFARAVQQYLDCLEFLPLLMFGFCLGSLPGLPHSVLCGCLFASLPRADIRLGPTLADFLPTKVVLFSATVFPAHRVP
jgi:hypothetical protein